MPDDEQLAPEALLPLTPTVFHILLALADDPLQLLAAHLPRRRGGAGRGRGRHRQVEATQHTGRVRVVLALEDGVGDAEPVHGEERRRYYRLTSFGQRVLQAEARRLEQLVHLAKSKRVLPGFGTTGGM